MKTENIISETWFEKIVQYFDNNNGATTQYTIRYKKVFYGNVERWEVA